MYKQINKDFTLYDAINAMVVGSTEAINEKIEDFELDSDVFGHTRDDICVGCLANTTLQRMHNVTFTPEENRVLDDLMDGFDFTAHAKAVKRNVKDVAKFEWAVNAFRNGRCERLFDYFGIKYKEDYDDQWYVDTEEGKDYVLEELAKVKEFNETVVANIN